MNSKLNLEGVLMDALQNASDAFVVYDNEGLLIACNKQFQAFYGYPDDLVQPGTSVLELIKFDIRNGNIAPGYDESRAKDYLDLRQSYQDLPRRNYEVTLKDGRVISISEHSTSAGGTVSIQRDISDQSVQKDELRRSAELFRAAFDADSNICTLSRLKTGKFIDVNVTWCNSLGHKREEAIGKTAVELGIWADNAHREEIVSAIKENPSLRGYQTYVVAKNGEKRDISLNAEVIELDGEPCLYFSAKDITDELKVENELQVAREQFIDFSKSGSDWFWETDDQYRFTFISSIVEDTTGIPSSNYIGLTMDEIVGVGARNQSAMRTLLDTLAERKPFRDIVIYRFHQVTGKKFWVRTSGIPYYDEDGEFKGFRGASTDITEQVLLEDSLQQSQKMEAVGQLTGGVAHDFNNLLAVIQGNAEIVLDALEEDHPELVHHLEAIMRSSDKGAELTQNMLAFSRNQILSPSVFRLDEHIQNMLDIVRRTIGGEIAIKTDFSDDLWLCRADPTKLESAFLNLCINAKESMPEGGTLTIEICNREVDENYAIMEKDVVPGKYVSLIISDTGCGISPEKLPHIMEPFFTTKEVGKGTGLGLSMVYGFARQSHGNLSIYSEVGIGTTVRLLLPIAEGEDVTVASEMSSGA